MPRGWKSNYNDIKEKIDTAKQSRVKVIIDYKEICHYSIIERSPLRELELMISKYEIINEEIKFLIFLYNSILISRDDNMFMLIGKAIEIINELFPKYKNKLLSEIFPESAGVFNNYTISKLKCLSNQRKESRHYVKGKGERNLISHESLTCDEKVMMYKCSTYLLHQVIRESFGLPRIILTK